MTMSVSSGGFLLDQPDALFHCQKNNDSGQYPESNAHIVTVAVLFFSLSVVAMAVTMTVAILPMMAVRLDRVGNQVQESIAQQSTRGEGEQRLQPWLHFLGVIQRNCKQDKERGGANQQGRTQRVDPDVKSVDWRLGIFSLNIIMMMVMMLMPMMIMSVMMVMVVIMMVVLQMLLFKILICLSRVLKTGTLMMIVVVIVIMSVAVTKRRERQPQHH